MDEGEKNLKMSLQQKFFIWKWEHLHVCSTSIWNKFQKKQQQMLLLITQELSLKTLDIPKPIHVDG